MDMQPLFPNDLLIAWFEKSKRTLPWREEPTPYRVWVSEVMLQQTRVAVVLDYFTRWMARFPTLQSLSEAPVEEVIKMWEGLGYYSRARNLHEGAKQCVAKYHGELPQKEEEIASIKGIGPYTLAALLNFAFRIRKPLIDGNVLRVMSRFFAIEQSIDLGETRTLIESKIDAFLPEKKFWVVSEALMEIGALLCLKKPLCKECPLQHHCMAHQKGIEERLPLRKPRKEIVHLTRFVAIMECEGQIALQKGERGKVMADLYEFPYVEEQSALATMVGEEVSWEKALPKVTHHFTHHRATLFPYLFDVKSKDVQWIWIDKENLLELPFSSGHRRILERYYALENTT